MSQPMSRKGGKRKPPASKQGMASVKSTLVAVATDGLSRAASLGTSSKSRRSSQGGGSNWAGPVSSVNTSVPVIPRSRKSSLASVGPRATGAIRGPHPLKPLDQTKSSSEVIVDAMCTRLIQMLPIRSNYTLSELEVDPIYSSTRPRLVKLALDGHLDPILDSLYSGLTSVSSSWSPGSKASVDQAPLPVLRSLYALLDIIMEIIQRVWDIEVSRQPASAKIYKENGLRAAPSLFNSALYLTAQPMPVKSSTVRNYLAILTKIQSDDSIMKELRLIQDASLISQSPLDAPSAPLHGSKNGCELCGAETIDTLVTSLDKRVIFICSFFASSNPWDYFDFLKSVTHSINVDSLYVPCSDLFGLARLSADIFPKYVQLLTDILHITKRFSQQALLVSFFASAMFNWAAYRTFDLVDAGLHNDSVTDKAEFLFDLISKVLESKLYRKAVYKVQAALISVLPDQFAKYNQSSSSKTFGIKRPTAFKSKQKFLSDLANILHRYPEAGSALTGILRVGCVVDKIDPQHPIVVFTKSTWKAIYRDVFDDHLSVSPSVLLRLRIQVYLVSLVMQPAATTKQVIEICNQQTLPTAASILPIVGGIHQCTTVPSLLNDLYPYLEEASGSLVKTVHRLACQVAKDEDDSFPELSSITSSDDQNNTESLARKVKGWTPSPSVSSLTTSDSSLNLSRFVTFKGVLTEALKIYRVCPFINFKVFVDLDKPIDTLGFDDRFTDIIKPVVILIDDHDRALSESVERFLMSMQLVIDDESKHISSLGTVACVSFIHLLSEKIINADVSGRHSSHMIAFLSRFVRDIDYRDGLKIRTEEDAPLSLSYYQHHRTDELISTYESVMFLAMFSDSVDVVRSARILLKVYLDAARGYPVPYDRDNVKLVQAIMDDNVPTSAVAVRKKLRDHLCSLRRPTDTLLSVWSIMYNKLASVHNYAQLADDIEHGKAFDPDAYNEQFMDDYGEYVSSMGGIIMSPDFDHDPRQPEYEKKLRLFLKYNSLCIFSEDTARRERSREILCVCLHPLLCGLLLEFMAEEVPDFERALKAGKYKQCELYVNTLRVIGQADTLPLFYFTVDYCQVVADISVILDYVVNKPEFLRVKLKFCKVQALFISRADELALDGSILHKNAYARIVAHYLEDSYSLDHAPAIETPANKFEYQELSDLHLSIKEESSYTLKLLFRNLPLDTRNHDLSSPKEEDLSAGVAFSSYFNLFLRILEKLHKELQGASLTSKNHREVIVQNIIQALTRLLSCNSEVGLKYSLPLSYHPDSLIRVSFIDVLSRIIEGVYSPKPSTNKPALISLVRILFVDSTAMLVAAVSMCPRSEVDAFANSILGITQDKYVQMSVLARLLIFDIINTNESVEILRSNTVATRLVALYTANTAQEYLIDTLGPFCRKLTESEEYFEIEKTSSMTPEEQQRNLDSFMKYMHLVVDYISHSYSEMPRGMRVIACVIYRETEKKFPDSTLAAVGAYLFLRIYNPAIVSPDRVGIVTPQNRAVKRSLIQIARVLQMLVNDSELYTKFPLLASRSEEIAQIEDEVTKFMLKVVDVSEEFLQHGVKEAHRPDVKFDYNAGTLYFHSFFYDHWPEIRICYSHPVQFHDDTYEEKPGRIRKVDSLLIELGLPSRIRAYEIPDSIKNDHSERGILLYDFMSQVSFKEQHIENPFSVFLTSEGYPLISVRIVELDDSFTRDTILYLWIQQLCKYWNDPFCVFVDATSYGKDTKLGPAMQLYYNLVPLKYRANCKKVYYYNISSFFLNDIKYYAQISDTFGVIPTLEFCFLTFEDNKRTFKSHGLLEYPGDPKEDEARVVFNDVSLYSQDENKFLPIKLKIGTESVQIYSIQPQRFNSGPVVRVVHTVDVYPLEDLGEIGPSETTGVPNEICMKVTSTGALVVLASPKKIEIMRTIYFARARVSRRVQVAEKGTDQAQEEYLDNSVGQLLNVGLSGLLNKDDTVRNASYSLLSSLVHIFSLDIGREIEAVKGVAFPYGDINYVKAVSTRLSENNPKLTYTVIRGFFDAFADASPENKNPVILYIQPWIKNIYRWVYMDDPEQGPARTSLLIRRFVKASQLSPGSQSFFMSIWNQLSLEDQLTELIVDQIVAATIDHEAQGHDWSDITRFWPLSPTVQVCGFLLRRMRTISYEMDTGDSAIESHTRWIEATALARLLSSLIFDSMLFIEDYIADIFYLATIYMNRGPLEMRSCMSKLLTRSFHAMLSSPGLTKEQAAKIKSDIAILNGARFQALFGLTREDNADFPMKTSSEAVSRAHSMSSLCGLLITFLDDFSTPEDFELRIIRWESYLLNVAFDDSSPLEGEAVLVLGSISRKGVNNVLVCKLLSSTTEMCRTYVKTLESWVVNRPMMICRVYSFSTAMEGLRPGSKFVPRLFWFSYLMLFFNVPLIYRFGVRCVGIALDKIWEHLGGDDKPHKVTLRDYLMETRKDFAPLLEEYESMMNMEFNERYFDMILAGLFSAGLSVSFCYQDCLLSLKHALKYRYAEYKQDVNRDASPLPGYCCYLWYIYLLSSSNEEFNGSLEECNVADVEMCTLDGGVKAPTVFVDWFDGSPSLDALVMDLLAVSMFRNSKWNEVFTMRAVVVYREHQRRYPAVASALWESIAPLLKYLLETASTQYLLDACQDVAEAAMVVDDQTVHEDYISNGSECLKRAHLEGFLNLQLTVTDPFVDTDKETLDGIRTRNEYVWNLADEWVEMSLNDDDDDK